MKNLLTKEAKNNCNTYAFIDNVHEYLDYTGTLTALVDKKKTAGLSCNKFYDLEQDEQNLLYSKLVGLTHDTYAPVSAIDADIALYIHGEL